MDKQLLSMLVCPLSKTPLHYDANAQELQSSASGLAYPIKDGIPVMLESQARTMSREEKQALSRKKTGKA